MYPFLALLLVTLAVFTVVVVRGREGVSDEAIGFTYVGAAALTLVAVAVVLIGRLSPVVGQAEGLALLGLGTYVVYLLAAWVVVRCWENRSR